MDQKSSFKLHHNYMQNTKTWCITIQAGPGKWVRSDKLWRVVSSFVSWVELLWSAEAIQSNFVLNVAPDILGWHPSHSGSEVSGIFRSRGTARWWEASQGGRPVFHKNCETTLVKVWIVELSYGGAVPFWPLLLWLEWGWRRKSSLIVCIFHTLPLDQLVLNLYIHQPESHQLSRNKVSLSQSLS